MGGFTGLKLAPKAMRAALISAYKRFPNAMLLIAAYARGYWARGHFDALKRTTRFLGALQPPHRLSLQPSEKPAEKIGDYAA